MTIGYIRRSLSYGGVWRIALALLLQTANARNRREHQARNVKNGVDLISHSQLTTVLTLMHFSISIQTKHPYTYEHKMSMNSEHHQLQQLLKNSHWFFAFLGLVKHSAIHHCSLVDSAARWKQRWKNVTRSQDIHTVIVSYVDDRDQWNARWWEKPFPRFLNLLLQPHADDFDS